VFSASTLKAATVASIIMNIRVSYVVYIDTNFFFVISVNNGSYLRSLDVLLENPGREGRNS